MIRTTSCSSSPAASCCVLRPPASTSTAAIPRASSSCASKRVTASSASRRSPIRRKLKNPGKIKLIIPAPRFVIARSEATWQSQVGTAVRNGPPLNRHAPPICHCEERSDVAISGRHCRSERAIVKTVRTSDLSLRGGRRPTWQSRSTRSDNRKASANSTPRKAVKA